MLRLPPRRRPGETDGGGRARPRLRFQPPRDASRGAPATASAASCAVGLVRPFPQIGFGIGAAVDLGTTTPIDRGGFRGDWSDWSILGVASWTIPIQLWEIEPWLAGGLAR
jgi:hypothetical protein